MSSYQRGMVNPMLKHLCLLCNQEIGTTGKHSGTDDEISHGLCPSCVPKFMAGHGCQFAEFLDSLPAPIFVIDDNTRILGSNHEGLRLIGKSAADTHLLLGGEAFECRHAKEPGGCGQTIHCKTCTIRKTVTQTFQTGESCIRVPAYMDLGNITQERSVHYLISTEKVVDVVLLRIDEVQAEAETSSSSATSVA